MRIRLMSLMRVAAGVCAFSSVLVAQNQAPTGGGETNRSVRRAASQANLPFDPKDFNGIWDRSSGGSRGISRRPGDDTTPPFTAKGKQMFDSYKPGYGPRAVPPATGNDPHGGVQSRRHAPSAAVSASGAIHHDAESVPSGVLVASRFS